MRFSSTKTLVAAVACALALAGPALADGGSGSSGSGSGDDEGTHLVMLTVNGPLVEMGDVEIRQRCENEAEFVVLNNQACSQTADASGSGSGD
jgi:hypothetical protein